MLQRVLFFGSDAFSAASLARLLRMRDARDAVAHVDVVVPADSGRVRGKAREMPVEVLAREQGVAVRRAPHRGDTREQRLQLWHDWVKVRVAIVAAWCFPFLMKF